MNGRIAVIGEAIADALHQPSAAPGTLDLRVYPGGGPANTAVSLARLGTPTSFLGRFSTGALGELLHAHLRSSGVDLSASVRTDDPAALAVAFVDRDGRARYEFYLNGCADWRWQAEELGRLPADTVCVHTGSLALAIEPGGRLIENLLAEYRRRGTVCIDPNVRPGIVDPAAYRAGIARWSSLADIIRLSDEDLPILAPERGFTEASRRWHKAGVRLVVLTQGPNGAVASLNGTVVAVPAVPVDAVDTVGAGDAFTAGLLHSLHRAGHLNNRLANLQSSDVAQAMALAAEVAARTCAVHGADPPWRGQLTTS